METTTTVYGATNLGPLTTRASLPDDCLKSLWDFRTPGLIPTTEAQNTFHTQGCAAASCCPDKLEPYISAYQWFETYYSPGVCPESYKACAGPTDYAPQDPKETWKFCCPSNYMCPENDPAGTWWACQSVVMTHSDPYSTIYVMEGIWDQNLQQVKLDTGVDGNPASHTYNVAYPIQIRYRDETFTTTSTSRITHSSKTSTTGAINTATTASATSGPINTPTTQPDDTQGNGKKSNVVPIALGVVLGVVILVVLLFCAVWFWRRGKKRREAQLAQEQQQQMQYPFQYPTGYNYFSPFPGQVSFKAPEGVVPEVHEFPTEPPAHELAQPPEPQELGQPSEPRTTKTPDY